MRDRVLSLTEAADYSPGRKAGVDRNNHIEPLRAAGGWGAFIDWIYTHVVGVEYFESTGGLLTHREI